MRPIGAKARGTYPRFNPRTPCGVRPNLDIRIQGHVRESGVKNPEFIINGVLADAKRVKSYKGIADGFRRAKKQGANIVLVDYKKSTRKVYTT